MSEGHYNGLRVLFYSVPGTNIFRGDSIYAGGYDEREAYLFFCRAALEYFKVLETAMNVALHLLIAGLLKRSEQHEMGSAASINIEQMIELC